MHAVNMIVFLCLILYINPIQIHRAPIWCLPAVFLYLRHDFHSDSENIYGNRVKFVTDVNIEGGYFPILALLLLRHHEAH